MLHVLAFAQRGCNVDVEAQGRLTLSVMSDSYETEAKFCPESGAKQTNLDTRLVDTHVSLSAVNDAIIGSIFIDFPFVVSPAPDNSSTVFLRLDHWPISSVLSTDCPPKS